MSMVLRYRISWTAAAAFILLFTVQFAPLHAQEQPASSAAVMERVRLSKDGNKFVMADSGTTFVPWGFNFVGEFGRIVEEYWEDDWPSVEEDFKCMRELGANVVRLHLQVDTYMKALTRSTRPL